MRRPTRNVENFICPHCGAEVAAGASHCRACGASDESGWGEVSWESDVDGYRQDDNFDYDEFLREEFPEQAPTRTSDQRKRLAMTILVVIVCLTFLIWVIR